MNQTTNDLFPHIDATKQDCITDEQAQFFHDNGLLLIRNLLRGRELEELQKQTLPLVERSMSERVQDPDYFYTKHKSGVETPFRIEYVVDKTQAGKVLAGHPFILKSVEKLQGPNFIPTWDSMVFKTPGKGATIAWHRDYAAGMVENKPIFNVDFYLDGSDMSNCLWGILGSNLWEEKFTNERITYLNGGNNDFTQSDGTGEFRFEWAVPIPVDPGDVLFHNVMALHGSPSAQSKLRRVIYYEYRPIQTELALGPHRPEYIPVKQKLLQACLRERAHCDYVDKTEKPFVYQPDAQFASPTLGPDEQLSTYRFLHGDYWKI